MMSTELFVLTVLILQMVQEKVNAQFPGSAPGQNPYPPQNQNSQPSVYSPPAAPAYSPPNAPPVSSQYAPIVPYSNLYSKVAYARRPIDCDDFSCRPDECCEFNGIQKVCVQQDPLFNAGFCVRPKRCDTTGDCPIGHCCVIRLDVPVPTQVGPLYGAYIKKERQERGECIIAGLVGEVCRRTVDGIQTSVCPCFSGLTCTFTASNPLTGTCT